MTLQRTLSEILFDEKIAEAEASAHLEGLAGISDYHTDKEHWYDTDILQLVQAEIVKFAMPARVEIQSMIVNELISYHANHLLLSPASKLNLQWKTHSRQPCCKTTDPSTRSSAPLSLEPARIR